jgi:hypothetical protein
MKNYVINYYKENGKAAIIPLLIYGILLIPVTVIFSITWLLKPIEPNAITELESI